MENGETENFEKGRKIMKDEKYDRVCVGSTQLDRQAQEEIAYRFS